jgi:hypothetical protein
MATVEQALARARSQIGTREVGYSNKVKYNQWYYGRSVSGAAYPWCAVFTSWVADHVGMRANVDYPKSAGVAVCFSWFIQHGRKVSKYNLKPGDWCRFTFSHVGIVEKVLSGGRVQTIEGNTSPGSGGSQRDGGGVWRRVRPLSLIQYGGRPNYASTPSKPSTSKGIFGMAVHYVGSTSRDRTLKKKMWQRLHVNDKGDTSLGTLKKGQDFLAVAEITVTNLKPGQMIMGRFYLVSYKKGTKERRLATYPAQDIIASSGSSYGKVFQMATNDHQAESGRSIRVRFEVYPGAGATVTSGKYRLAKG